MTVYANNKILAIVGPTASGKSELAVRLAKKFNGEIISCDSRQIYVGMDIGTGKVTGKWQLIPFASHPERVRRSEGSHKNKIKADINLKFQFSNLKFIYKSVPHHCIDYVSPRAQYSVARFQKDALRAIKDIQSRGKLPILCGGTGHWVDAVAYNQTLPDVKPDKKLRKQLEKKSADELFAQLKKLDPARAKTIDAKNKRRLIRALEIILTTGKPVPSLPLFSPPQIKSLEADPPLVDKEGGGGSLFNVLWIGISLPQQTLYQKIDKRLHERLKQGMIKEVQRLHVGSRHGVTANLHRGFPLFSKEGGGGSLFRAFPRKIPRLSPLSWQRLESFGLEYKYLSLYLQKKLTYDEMLTQLSCAIKHYSKRQMTWFKRNKNIRWASNFQESKNLVEIFLQ